MDYETVIGLEVHAQLLTESKMFCTCSADYASTEPNTHVCPVCLGMPGVLPVINRKALEYTVMTALALNCIIPEFTKFDRKNYPYPDLMKGYQISQYDEPVGIGGWLDIEVDGRERRAGITRVHLEEDTAKLTHRSPGRGESYSMVDVNRAGVPLMEIVGEPDLSSPEEARQYLIKLRAILQFLGVSTGNMEEGSFRCDANISIRPVGGEHSVKVEVKNMNSFKAVYRALQYEDQRQRKAVDSGERLTQETRGWVEDKGITVSQRSKEHAHDYRYLPEPDLPPMVFERDWVEGIRIRLPELPEARKDRFIADYTLSDYDAGLLTMSKATADYFETCLDLLDKPKRKEMAKTVSNWMLGEFTRLLNATDTEIEASLVKPILMVELIKLADSGKISMPTAKSVFEEMFRSGKSAAEVVEAQGLTQISDAQEIVVVVDKVIAANTKAAEDFKQGKDQALQFLVGQVMRETKGRANHAVVTKLLRERLGE